MKRKVKTFLRVDNEYDGGGNLTGSQTYCSTHPRYKGEGTFQSGCIPCWRLFERQRTLKDIHHHSCMKWYFGLNDIVEMMLKELGKRKRR